MSGSTPINFTRGVPAVESFPIKDVTQSAIAVLEQHGASIMQYGPSYGFLPFREWLAQWRGVSVDQVMTGNGSLQLVELLCLHLIRPGDVVFTEAPTYDRAITLFRRHRANVIGIQLETDGPNLVALEAALRAYSPKIFYIIPDFQNPAGTTCSLEKRKRIVALAEKHNFLLLEDSPYRALRYRGKDEPTLFELAPQHTLHMSSFSKLISPGVRVGYMLGRADRVAQLAKVAEDTYISPNYLAHGVAYEWCRRGLLQPQIDRLKTLYAPRQEACLAAIDRRLPDVQATRPDGGFFLSITLPHNTHTTAVRAAASRRNLYLSDGLGFFPNGGGEDFLRLPYCALSPEEIDEGIQRLADAVKDVQRGG